MDDSQIPVRMTSMKVSDRVRRNANERAMMGGGGGEGDGALEPVGEGKKAVRSG